MSIKYFSHFYTLKNNVAAGVDGITDKILNDWRKKIMFPIYKGNGNKVSGIIKKLLAY